jgi:Zn finger protein HypA/HybF involved in hydrogenase expression
MPLPPAPMTFTCTQCNWRKTTAPLSDALGPGDWYQQCPTCGNPNLKVSRASAVASLLARAGQYLDRRAR